LWPGGGRGWDGNETGRTIVPAGIQPVDVAEPLEHVADIVGRAAGHSHPVDRPGGRFRYAPLRRQRRYGPWTMAGWVGWYRPTSPPPGSRILVTDPQRACSTAEH
jgi:hypothetical protein